MGHGLKMKILILAMKSVCFHCWRVLTWRGLKLHGLLYSVYTYHLHSNVHDCEKISVPSVPTQTV